MYDFFENVTQNKTKDLTFDYAAYEKLIDELSSLNLKILDVTAEFEINKFIKKFTNLSDLNNETLNKIKSFKESLEKKLNFFKENGYDARAEIDGNSNACDFGETLDLKKILRITLFSLSLLLLLLGLFFAPWILWSLPSIFSLPTLLEIEFIISMSCLMCWWYMLHSSQNGFSLADLPTYLGCFFVSCGFNFLFTSYVSSGICLLLNIYILSLTLIALSLSWVEFQNPIGESLLSIEEEIIYNFISHQKCIWEDSFDLIEQDNSVIENEPTITGAYGIEEAQTKVTFP